jgi:energy-converting hydrogenase Eha subunit C
MFIIAVLFVRSTPLRKLFVLALTIIGLILAAVFLPTFVSQLATGSFFAAICVVLLVWLVAMAVPRREKSKARADAAPAEKATEDKLEPQAINETLQDADAAKSEFKPEQPLDGGSSNA